MEPKRLWTSYYAKAGRHPMAVAITVVPLRSLPGLKHCKVLAPSGRLLSGYKKGLIDKDMYTEMYLSDLSKRGLTPQAVLDTLEDGSVLLCYERPGSFCHRHLAAGWLRRAGPDKVIIEELP